MMEIYAKCKFDYESVKALTFCNMYRKRNPKKQFIISMCLCAFIIVSETINGILWGFEDFLLLGIGIFLVGITVFMHFVFPKMQYKALGKMKNIENEYTFYDDIIEISTKGEEYHGTGEIRYSMIPRVYETSKYFFIFQNGNQVYLVEKETIINGTVEEIREKLKQYVNKKKYIICRY